MGGQGKKKNGAKNVQASSKKQNTILVKEEAKPKDTSVPDKTETLAVAAKDEVNTDVVEETIENVTLSGGKLVKLDKTGSSSTLEPLPVSRGDDSEKSGNSSGDSPARHGEEGWTEGASPVSPLPALTSTPQAAGYETPSEPSPRNTPAMEYYPVLGQPDCQMPENWGWKADVPEFVPGMEGMDGAILPADSFMQQQQQQMQALSAAMPGAVLVQVPIVTGGTYPGPGASAIAVGPMFPDGMGAGAVFGEPQAAGLLPPAPNPVACDANGNPLEAQEDWQRDEEVQLYTQRAEQLDEKVRQMKETIDNDRKHLLREVAALKAVLNRYMIPHDEVVPLEEPQVHGEGPDAQAARYGRDKDGLNGREHGLSNGYYGSRQGGAHDGKDDAWPSQNGEQHGDMANGCGESMGQNGISANGCSANGMVQPGIQFEMGAFGDNVIGMNPMVVNGPDGTMFFAVGGDPTQLFAMNGIDGMQIDPAMLLNGDVNGHMHGDLAAMNGHIPPEMMNGMNGMDGHMAGHMNEASNGGNFDGANGDEPGKTGDTQDGSNGQAGEKGSDAADKTQVEADKVET